MENDTKETLIWIFMIVVMLVLSGKIAMEADSYDCNMCTVTLENEMAGGPSYEFGTFKISELYEEYIDGHCAIAWDPTQGFTNA
jgi:hypothetical protein